MNHKLLLLPLAIVALSACSGGSDSGSGVNPRTPVGEITAIHRSGQTFLSWSEKNPSVRYHVYRHTAPITADNLSDATRLTQKWGSLGPDTSVNTHGSDNVPSNFVIEDLGTPLSDNTGLFVYTIPNNQQGDYYYAVSNVINGEESTDISLGSNSLENAVNESTATPQPVLVASENDGKGRIYQQYMDYDNWNPTLNGYAYDFGLALPYNYDPAKSYPLQLALHAFGESYTFLTEAEFNWEIIQLSPIDPGLDQGSEHTWWYGFATDHNYQTSGSIPTQGTVSNFTEQRVLAAVRSVQNNSEFNVNNELTHIVGHSMGASGALTLGLRYPNVFSGIYASEPMTNYRTSPLFQGNFEQLWGDQQLNLPIVNAGDDNGPISRYGQGQSDETGVWDWMNHQQQIRRRSDDEFAYLMIDHGKADFTIDWQTQGQPLVSALTDAQVGFSANAFDAVGHEWLAFGAVVKSMFGLGFDDMAPWRYPLSLSYPAIHNATGSSSIDPGPTGDDSYNLSIEWSAAVNLFDQPIVDTSNRYEITLRSVEADQFADITPRRTQAFRPSIGQQCSWNATRVSNGQATAGNAVVQSNGLITITNVPLYTGTGTRLAINC